MIRGSSRAASPARYWPGLQPVSARKLRTKWLWSKKPSCWARHAIGSCAPGSSWQRTLDAAAAHIAQRAGAGAAAEQAHQMEAADAGAGRQLGHPQRLRQVLIDIAQGALQCGGLLRASEAAGGSGGLTVAMRDAARVAHGACPA
jgi:hypothetical protein